MDRFTLEDLIAVLKESAGEDEEVDWSGEVIDLTFEDLGYDSLALFNTVSKIERDLGIRLPDDVVSHAGTPRALLREVNETVGQPA
jgi:act minimal PKS acyl carrier protein